jgi:hypothetical protein
VNLDELELELRKLPGVRSIGFTKREDLLFVQVHVEEPLADVGPGLALHVSRIAARHSERPVAVELVRQHAAVTPRAAGLKEGADDSPPDEERLLRLEFNEWEKLGAVPVADGYGDGPLPPSLRELRHEARLRSEAMGQVLQRAAIVLFLAFVLAAVGAIRYVSSEFGGDADIFRYAAAVADVGTLLVAAVVAWVGATLIRAMRGVQQASFDTEGHSPERALR